MSGAAGGRIEDEPSSEPSGEAAGGCVDPLESGAVRLVGQLAGSSNETFLVALVREDADDPALAIYKPELGERPLHDFPPGLFRRERAAYVLSEWLGWGLVPRTIIRDDAPFGIGSLQAFVPHDPDEHYFVLHSDAPETHRDLRRLAAFDFVTNNTDRKAGHVLRGSDDGRIWGIDHGLCFSSAYKLRTVVWEFQGETVPEDVRDDIGRLIDDEPAEFAELLDEAERRAVRGRARALFAAGTLPVDPTGMRYPWPLI